MIILFFFAIFLFCGLIAFGECYYERDWPRHTGRFALLAGILFLFSLSAFGQNVRWDLPIYTVQAQGGNLLPVYAIPGAGIKFYSCSGSTCTTLATTYISATSSTTCPVSPTPMQVVLNGSSTCVSSADPYGNMGGWFQQGQYMATITAQGSSYNYIFTVGSGAVGGGCFPNTVANGCTGATTAQGADGNLGVPGPIFNLAGCGAVGNGTFGVPASTDTANTTAIQSCFNQAVAAHGEVFVPCGIWNINSPLTMYGAQSAAIVGAHWDCSIIQYTGTTPVSQGMLTVAGAAPATPCTSVSCDHTTGQPSTTFLHWRMEELTLIANHNLPDNLDLLDGAWFSTKDTLMIGAANANYFLIFTQQGQMDKPMAEQNAFANLGWSVPTTVNAFVTDSYNSSEAVNNITITSPIFMGLTNSALLLNQAGGLIFNTCQFSNNPSSAILESTADIQFNTCLFEQGGSTGTVTLGTAAGGTQFTNSNIASNITIAGTGTQINGGLTSDLVTIASTARGTVISNVDIAGPEVNVIDDAPDTQYHANTSSATGLLVTNFPADKITEPYSTFFGAVSTQPERLQGTYASISGAAVNLDPALLYAMPGSWTANFCGIWENVSTGYYNVPGCYEFTSSSPTLTLSDSKVVTVSANTGGRFTLTVSGSQTVVFSGSIDLNPLGNNGGIGHFFNSGVAFPGGTSIDGSGNIVAGKNFTLPTLFSIFFGNSSGASISAGSNNLNIDASASMGQLDFTGQDAGGLVASFHPSSVGASIFSLDSLGNISNANGIILPYTITGFNGNSSGVHVPLAVSWTGANVGQTICPDANGNLTVSGCAGGGGGGVSSVALTVPSWLTVTGSPVTSSGTLAVAPTTAQTSHQVIGTCGTATTFGPCTLVAGDIPTLNQNTTGNAATATLATGATNVAGGVANDIPYQTAASTTSFVTPVNSAVLVSSSGGVPAESTTLPSGLTIPGYAPALVACSDESSTFTPANSTCYFVTASVSTATPAASAFVIFTITTSSAGTMALTGTTIADGGGCSSYISGTTLTLTSSQTVSVKSDGTTIRASCTAAAGTGTVTSVAVSSPLGGGPITTTGTITCATCVVASAPGAGIAHFAGSTQTVTSSLVALASDVSGQLPIGNVGSSGLSGSGGVSIASTGAISLSGIPLTALATQATNTVVMNATAGTAAPTAVAMPTCTSGADLYNTTTSAWSCVSTGGGTPAYPLTITGGVSGGVVYGSLSTQLTVSPAGTANVLMKWGGAATAPGNSSVTDNGTAVTTTDTGGYVGPVFTANGTTAGFADYPQGTTSAAVAPCNVANSICIQAPTSVTSQLRVFAGAPATGLPLYTNSSGTMTETILPLTGSGPNVQSALIAGAPTYTAGASVTSCVQATGYTNSNERGEVTIVGGTATTGTICTVNFSTTLASAPGMCQVTQNGGTTVFSIGHGTPGTSSFTITSGISVVSSTLNVDYDCTP